MRRFLPFILRVFVAWGFSAAIHAQIIWSDNFTGQAAGALPTTDFPGGVAGSDYAQIASGANATFTVDGSVGNPAPGLAVVDTGTAGTDQATLQVTMDQFAPFDVSPASATPILRVSFDLRVDSYLAAANTNIPRFILRANNVNNTGSQIVIAFGRAFLNDADATEDLVVYADTATGNTSNVPPKDISAIGLIPGIGWQPGFDLGTYDAADGTLNDTNDEFYRIALDYNSISGTITGSATQLSTGAVATFPTGLTLTPGTSFSNASGTSVDRFLLASSVGNTAMAYFDNFVFQAVPEPTTSMLLLAAMGVVCVRRRKNSSIASTR